MTGPSLEAVLAVFTRLEVLRVCGLDAVTDSTLAAVGRTLPRLRILDLQAELQTEITLRFRITEKVPTRPLETSRCLLRDCKRPH